MNSNKDYRRNNSYGNNDDIKNHLHIVFGFEHYNPLGIVRSLGEYGIRPVCIVIKNERPITSKSKYIGKLHMVDSIKEGYDLLLELYGKWKMKPFIYASDDQVTNYMDKRYDDIKDKFYFYNAGIAGRINKYQNKNNILQCANKNGLNILNTYVVNKGEVPEGIEYPVITKAIISTIDNWKSDMIICWNENELRDAYKVIKSEKILLQKYIEKKNELCMEGFSIDNGKLSFITIAATYKYKIEDSYSPYMLVASLEDDSLRNKLLQMLAEIGFNGIFEIEFLIDKDDTLYFLEINFRNSTWSYASTVAGMPLPILWAKGMINPKKIYDCLVEIKEPFTAMVEFDDFRIRVKNMHISKLAWVKDFINSKCKYYCCSYDYKPVFSVVFCKLKKQLSMIGRNRSNE